MISGNNNNILLSAKVSTSLQTVCSLAHTVSSGITILAISDKLSTTISLYLAESLPRNHFRIEERRKGKSERKGARWEEGRKSKRVEKGGKIGGGKEEEEDVPRCKEDAEHVRRKDDT